MKIVLTTHQFLPEFSSGTEIITYTIARELRRRGHEITIVTGSPAPADLPEDQRFDEYTYDDFRIIRYRHTLAPIADQSDLVELEFNNFFFLKFFRKLLDQLQPDILHCIHLQRLTTSALTVAAERNLRAFYTATDFWLVCPIAQMRLPDGSMCSGPRCGGANCARHLVRMTQSLPVINEVESRSEAHIEWEIAGARSGFIGPNDYTRYILTTSARIPFIRGQAHHCCKIFVPSHFMRQMLVNNQMPDSRMHLLPYGIETSRITRDTNRGTLPTLRITYTGTISELKGVHVLVKAFRSLPPDLPAELNIHGKLTDFPAFVEELRQTINHDPRIHFRGPYNHNDVNTILQNTDLLVCPSVWYENTPLVIYEANAAGIPVLATDLPGMAETVRPGVNGFLFPTADYATLAARLLLLCNDRSLLLRLAEGTIVPMSISQHVDALEHHYTEE